MSQKTFHLIGNAHLDPVWLWDWRDGLNEGIITCRAILDLMDERPELTFSRGESAIYEHIEKTAPDLFERIASYVHAGRWEATGGTYIQPDNNVPSTETLVRHLTRGQNYFRSRFGRPVEVLWAADSFGHPAGLPEIMASAGITSFASTRPDLFPIHGPFWWVGPGGSRVLCYRPLCGWYGTEREEVPRRLDGLLQASAGSEVRNVGVLYGLGNHGGGPSRRQLMQIDEWRAAHPEVNVVYSGFQNLFDALRAEASERGDETFPSHTGGLQYFARGCYSSVAKHKFAYHGLESGLCRAERTATAISTIAPPPTGRAPLAPLVAAWDAVLFHTFHDILPGSSIERAFDEQLDWIGGARHAARSAEFDAINRLANLVDTSVRPAVGFGPTGAAILVWNPHPFAITTPIEIEANVDYRQVQGYGGRPDELPFELIGPDGTATVCQRIRQEALVMEDPPWRVRVALRPELPPLGWTVYELAYREGAKLPEVPAEERVSSPAEGVIQSARYRVEATVGATGVRISRDGRPLVIEAGLGVMTVEDPYGSWGEPNSDAAAPPILGNVRHEWRIEQAKVLDAGPLRATLWVRMTGGNSALDLMFTLTGARDAVDVSARLLWNERAARVRLAMPVGGGVEAKALYDMPGGASLCEQIGELPGGRWVQVITSGQGLGFASDSLSSFSVADGIFHATVARAARYACGHIAGPEADPWTPAVDRGELKFRFLLTGGEPTEVHLADALCEPPVVQTVLAREGKLPKAGSLGRMEPSMVRLIALKPAEDGRGLIVRAHNGTSKSHNVSFTVGEIATDLGELAAGRIGTWRLVSDGARVVAEEAGAID